MVKILGMRHGQKDGDKLTALGAQQVFAAGENLLALELNFDRLIHSGADRTKQSLCILTAAMKLYQLPMEENERFLYSIGKDFLTGHGEFKAEMLKIQQAGGNLAVALRMSEYAQFIRESIRKSLIDLAHDMEDKGQKSALVISHSPLIITASPNPQNTPYGIYECDGILYTINNRVISDSFIIRAPLKGDTTW